MPTERQSFLSRLHRSLRLCFAPGVISLKAWQTALGLAEPSKVDYTSIYGLYVHLLIRGESGIDLIGKSGRQIWGRYDLVGRRTELLMEFHICVADHFIDRLFDN